MTSSDSAIPAAATPLPNPAAQPRPAHWTPLSRFGFRCTLLYFFCFLFSMGNGSLLDLFFAAGSWVEAKLEWPFAQVSEWAAAHLFHITGVGAHFHPSGSGDTAVQWVEQLVFVVFAVGGALLWTGIATLRGSRRTEYQTLYATLRFLLRLTCAMFLFSYGLDKLFPQQMAPPSIAILNEPVGNMSPMTMLWSLIGLNPWYEMVCGAAEVMAGVLLLFRRTALFGALLASFVMANVLLYNLFFDVPVKLFAANLLFALLFLCLPDASALWSFFWKHQPAAPIGIWIPPGSRKSFRIVTRTVEIVYIVAIAIGMTGFAGYQWLQNRKDAARPTPLLGAWHVVGSTPDAGALEDPEHGRITDLYVDSNVRAFTRGPAGELWRTPLKQDAAAHTVGIAIYVADPRDFTFALPDPNHLTLTAVPPKPDPKAKLDPKAKPFQPATITLVRTPVPAHYPLLDRGFHWVNEWGLER